MTIRWPNKISDNNANFNLMILLEDNPVFFVACSFSLHSTLQYPRPKSTWLCLYSACLSTQVDASSQFPFSKFVLLF